MAEIKTYVRLDKVGATDPINSVVSKEALKNGQFIKLGVAEEDGEGEAVLAEKAAVGVKPDAFMASVFIDHGHPDFDIMNEEIKPGKVGRAYNIVAGRVISVNQEIATGLVKGDDVTVAVDGLGFKKAEVDEHVVGKVIRVDYLANIGDLVVVRFN